MRPITATCTSPCAAIPTYGEVSGRNIDDLDGGRAHRGELRTKRDPLDFALWKAAKPGEPMLGKLRGARAVPAGTPSALPWCIATWACPSTSTAAAADLAFPHHENECAQADAAHWHAGLLQSPGCIAGMLLVERREDEQVARQLLYACARFSRTIPATALRLLMLQTHYRSPLDFSVGSVLDGAESCAGPYRRHAVQQPAIGQHRTRRPRVPMPRLRSRTSLTQAAASARRVRPGHGRRLQHRRCSGRCLWLCDRVQPVLGGRGRRCRGVGGARRSRCPGRVALHAGYRVARARGGAARRFASTWLANWLILRVTTLCAEAAEKILAARAEARAAKNWGLADAIRDQLKDLRHWSLRIRRQAPVVESACNPGGFPGTQPCPFNRAGRVPPVRFPPLSGQSRAPGRPAASDSGTAPRSLDRRLRNTEYAARTSGRVCGAVAGRPFAPPHQPGSLMSSRVART